MYTALHRKHWGSRREKGTEGRVANLRMISYQFCHVNVNVLYKHTLKRFIKVVLLNINVLHCNKQGGSSGLGGGWCIEHTES